MPARHSFMRVNAIYQLVSMQQTHAWMFEPAEHLLFLPDLLRYILCGDIAAEYTMPPPAICSMPAPAIGIPKFLTPRPAPASHAEYC